MKKHGIWIGCMLILLSGCATPKEVKEEVAPQGEKKEDNKLKQLTLDEAFKKIDEKEKFVFIVTQSTCSYCNSFKRTLVPFLNEHLDIPFYEIEVDMLGSMKADTSKNFEKLQEKISEFTGGTPDMFCYADGELVKSISGEISEQALHNFMIDCDYIEGEKKEEPVPPSYEWKPSEYIKEVSMMDVAKKLDEKDSFYLMINETDRYNQAFIETIVPVLTEKEIEVYSLNFSTQTQGDQIEMNEAYEKIMKAVADLQMTPTVYEIKEGTARKLTEDNVSLENFEQAIAKDKEVR